MTNNPVKCYRCSYQFKVGDTAYIQDVREIVTKGNRATISNTEVFVCGSCR